MYTRAAATDYDDWESEFGNEGWSSKHLIPLLKKTETYQVKEGEATHGYTGPLKVSWGGTFTNVGEQFLDVAAKYDQERGTIDDINGLHECNEYGRWQKWINGETGTRSDVPHHFIYNQGENKNLHILTGQKVKRVIFEGIRAVGVEYVRDKTLDSQADQTVRTARASKLVVVSAGAFGSPTILERSGIGGARVLGEVGIDVRVDLPGVGQNYQDHNFVPAPYLASEDAETLDGIFRGDATAEEENLKLFAQGKGLIAHNGLDAGIKLRPTPHDLQELGPEFESRWRTFFANKVDKPVIWLGPFSCYIGDPSTAPIRKYYTIGYYTQYPVSRGSVHISSKDDPHAPHDFDPGFLTDPADVATLQWGYKKSRELARRMGVYRGEYLPGHPKFAARSPALCSDDAVGPVPIDTPDIQYTEEDEEVIETYNRNFVQTAWHSLGTCAMKPRGAGGVVDSRLNVYGVEGLKVADISIAPQNVGANTYSTALVIGEKAAVIIAEEYGIADF